MYIEDKSGGLTWPCRIGRVWFSKTGATLYYGDRAFKSLTGSGFKANYFDQVTGEHFWISGPRRDGADGLYGRLTQPEDVDKDVAQFYRRDIRGVRSTPTAGSKLGEDIKPLAEDRLPFECRNTVEHHRSSARSAAPRLRLPFVEFLESLDMEGLDLEGRLWLRPSSGSRHRIAATPWG